MRLPQVSDRIKESPAQALRGVFAGIGQLLLITDKLRNKTPASRHVPPARAPERSETRADPAPAAPSAPPAGPAPSAPPAGPAPSAPPAGPATSAPPAGPATSAPPAGPATSAPPATSATSAPPAAPAASAPPASAPPAQRVPQARDFDKTGNVRLITSGEAAAPLPNYGELTIASLRARLRNLDLMQVRQLAAYEQAHAARADVMIMYERRIAKLEASASAEEDEKAEVEAREEVAEEIQAEVAAEAENEA